MLFGDMFSNKRDIYTNLPFRTTSRSDFINFKLAVTIATKVP